MLLSNTGERTENRFLTVPGDDELPAAGAVLLEADRFFSKRDNLSNRGAGIVWPNNRDVAELAPYFDGLALIALVFPTFRDGRAYSQSRRLRELGFRGELRATGDVLRDQVIFMLRSGFSTFDIRKEHDAASFQDSIRRYSVFYQPGADDRTIAAEWRKRRHNGGPPERHLASAGTEDAVELDRRLQDAEPKEIIAEAVRIAPKEQLALVSSFGIESAALLKVVADIEPSLPILFLDTEWLFPETLAYRDVIIKHLGLMDVRTIAPSRESVAASDPDYGLWAENQSACCSLRKVAPLAEALAPFKAWISGRKRYQGGKRALMPVVEADGTRLKFNPFARVSPKIVAAIFRSANLPRHPLSSAGFTSVGCIPCTTPVSDHEAPRAGRFRGTGRTECGIHLQPTGLVAAE